MLIFRTTNSFYSSVCIVTGRLRPIILHYILLGSCLSNGCLWHQPIYFCRCLRHSTSWVGVTEQTWVAVSIAIYRQSSFFAYSRSLPKLIQVTSRILYFSRAFWFCSRHNLAALFSFLRGVMSRWRENWLKRIFMQTLLVLLVYLLGKLKLHRWNDLVTFENRC